MMRKTSPQKQQTPTHAGKYLITRNVESDGAEINLLRFCKQTEENDPSEEYEEYLACAVCGDNGKKQ